MKYDAKKFIILLVAISLFGVVMLKRAADYVDAMPAAPSTAHQIDREKSQFDRDVEAELTHRRLMDEAIKSTERTLEHDKAVKRAADAIEAQR